MIEITSLDRKKFAEEGFIVIKGQNANEDLSSLAEGITRLGKFFFDHDFRLDSPIKNEFQNQIGPFYKVLRYLPELFRLASSKTILKLVSDLGLEHPLTMNSNNVRFDPPDNRALFHWHQDTTYLLGSTNAITIWIPLTGANKFQGSIEVIPGSHKSGLFPFRFTNGLPDKRTRVSPKDIYLTEDPKETPLMIEVEPCDLVVFSQMLLHRSTPNFSNHPRVTTQLRYSDLKDGEFRNADYPFGDVTNITQVPSYLQLGERHKI